VQLIEKAIKNSSKSGDVIIDCFGGSGSTLIACEKTNRKCYMMELDPKYLDRIVKRWEDYTGRKAELLNG
jgi:DNA modification methylase